MILRRVISVLILFVGERGGGGNKPCDACEVIWIIYYLVGQNNHYYFMEGG